MKWVKSLTVYRHGQSAYNELKHLKDVDPGYNLFKAAFEDDYISLVEPGT